MALDPAALNRATAWLVRLAAVAFAALAVTGLPLILLYRPDGGGWTWLSGLHGLASSLFLGAAAATVLVVLVAVIVRHRLWAGWVLPVAAFVVAAVGVFTGPLLAWDHLALSPVTDGDSYRGVFDPVGGDVVAIIVDDAEIARGTYVALLVVHLLAVPAAAVAVGRLLWRRLRTSADRMPDRVPDRVPDPVSDPGLP